MKLNVSAGNHCVPALLDNLLPLLFYFFAKYRKRASNYEDMSSCISSKEELVAKQLVSGAMATMNCGTTQFV